MLQKLYLKEYIKKTAEATGDLARNKIADTITSVGKIKSKEKEKNYIPAEKETANHWLLTIALNIVWK